MRIAVITSSYPRFSSDTVAPFIRCICEHLAKLGHDVEVVAPYDPAVVIERDPLVPVNRFRYIWPERFHIMGHGKSLENDMHLRPLAYLLLPLFLISSFSMLWRLTSRQKSQAIHAHWVIPNGLVAAWVGGVRGIPFILSLHGSDVFVAQRNRLFRMVAKWVFRRASAVTTCSPDLQRAAIDLGAPQKTLIVDWGADPEIFYPGLQSVEKRRELQRDGSEKIVATIGRFVHKKGFNILLEAMPEILTKTPKVRLIMVGDGFLMPELVRQANDLGISDNVNFPGVIPWAQTPDLLANVDVFVLPSVRDPLGNADGLPTVLLEAMSCGAAVVASDIGGISRVINNGQNGILVPSSDARTLAENILNLLRNEDLQQALGKSARQTIEARYNWTKVAERTSELLELAIIERATAR